LAASWLKADPPQWPTYPSISLSPPTLLVSLHFALTSVPPSRAPKLLNQVQSETPHWVVGAIDNKKKQNNNINNRDYCKSIAKQYKRK